MSASLQPRSSTFPHRARWLAWVVLVALFFQVRVRPCLFTPSVGFGSYYEVAREFLDGVPVIDLYDHARLEAKLRSEGLPADRMLGPPTLVVTALPVAWLPYPTARALWMVTLLVPALVGSLAWLGRRMGPWWGLAFALAWLAGRPAAEDFEMAQTYPLLLALHCLALWAWQRNAPARGGAAQAVMIALRGWYGLLLGLGWAVAGRWRGLAWTAAITAVLLGASVPLLGLNAWQYFLRIQGPETARSPTGMVLAYQTWRSLALHLTTFHRVYGPDPPLPGAGASIWVAGVVVVGGLSLWAGRRLGMRPEGFALWTAASLLLAPVAEDYHMLLAALPAAVLWQRAPRLRPLVVLALLLLLPPWPYDRPTLLGGWRSMAAYPRVYGVGLLWLGCLLAAVDGQVPGPLRRLRAFHLTGSSIDARGPASKKNYLNWIDGRAGQE